jgi:hypothetical protein
MITQKLNQFKPSAMPGDSVKGANLNKVSARINPASTSTALFAGQAVKLVTGASPEILVDAIGEGDAVFGVILYNVKKNTYSAADVVEIALDQSVVWLEASAAITRGTAVATDPASGTVAAASAGASVTGIALSESTAAAQVVAVYVKTAPAATVASATVLGGVKVGAGLAINGDGVLSVS